MNLQRQKKNRILDILININVYYAIFFDIVSCVESRSGKKLFVAASATYPKLD